MFMFHRFFGGIHPHDGKELAKGAPIETMPAPDVVIICFRSTSARHASRA